nr:MAG TPA: hypothetical protein [Caudoviricetes sp.]
MGIGLRNLELDRRICTSFIQVFYSQLGRF